MGDFLLYNIGMLSSGHEREISLWNTKIGDMETEPLGLLSMKLVAQADRLYLEYTHLDDPLLGNPLKVAEAVACGIINGLIDEEFERRQVRTTLNEQGFLILEHAEKILIMPPLPVRRRYIA